MKKGLVVIFVGSMGLFTGNPAQAFGPADALEILGDIMSIVTHSITIFESYKKLDATTKTLTDKFNEKYDPRKTPYDQFVVNQALAYVELVVEVTRPLASMVRIVYKIFKIMQPIDPIIKEATQGIEAAYNSIDAIYKGARTVKWNLGELLKMMQGKQYSTSQASATHTLHLTF